MALLLCFCMMLSLMPLSSFAYDETEDGAAEVSASVEALMEDDGNAEEEATEDESEEEESAEDETVEEESAEDESAEEETAGDESAEEESAADEAQVSLTAVSVEETEEDEAEAEDETDMPAVTLTAELETEDEGETPVTVTVAAPEGAFADGVTMTVETLTDEDAEAFLAAVAEQDFALYDETYTVIDSIILDISFYVDGVEVQPAEDVTVTISGLDLATEDADGLEASYALVYHMDDDGNVEWIEDEQSQEAGLDFYTFTASDFSAYGIVNVNVEYGVSEATVSTSANITFSSFTSRTFEHCDIKYVVMDSTGSGYTLSDVTSVVIKDSSGNTKYTSTNISYASGTSNYQCFFGTNKTHSISLLGSYTVTITFVIKDSDNNTQTLTASFDSSSTYAEGTYYPTTASNASKLYYYLYGTSTIPSGVTQIDVSGMSIFLVAAILCDSSSVTGLGTVTGDTKDWGLDFAIDISTLLTYSTSFIPEVTKTFDADIEDGAFSFTLYNATVSDSTWTLGSAIETKYTTAASATDNSATDAVSFTALTYTSNGTYYYIVTENDTNLSGVTYDSSVYGIAVTVSGTTVTAAYYNLTATTETGVYTQGTSANAVTFSNSSTTATVDVDVTKTWVDSDNAYNTRPTSITYTLWQNSTTEYEKVTVSASNSWAYSWTDLPAYDGSGVAYTYTVTEGSVTGYTTTNTSSTDDDGNVTYAFTNTLNTTSVSVEKVWEDDSSFNLQPSSVDVTLQYTYTDDSQTEQTGNYTGTNATVTLSDSNSWSYTWSALPTYINGYAVTWSVVEADFTNDEHYTTTYSTANDGTLVVTNTLNVAELSITKEVQAPDTDTSDTTFSFTISGFPTDSEVTTVTVIITDDSGTVSSTEYSITSGSITFNLYGGQTATIQYVPTDSSLTATYTVTETASASWDTEIEGGTQDTENDKSATVAVTAGKTTAVTYTNTITGYASIAITKYWSDSSDLYNTRPDNDGTSFTVTLTPVTATTVDEVTTYSLDTSNAITTSGTWTDNSNTWTITLENVPVYDEDGNAITYAITETDLSSLNYSMSVGGYSGTVKVGDTTYYTITPASNTASEITNTLDTATVTVTKTVVDEDGNTVTDNTDSFRIALYAYTRTYDAATDTYVYEAAYDTSGNQIVFETTVTTGGSLNATVPLGYYWSVSEWVTNNDKTAYNASFTVNGGTIVGGVTYRWYYENSGNWINTYRYIYIDSDDASISISIKNTQQKVSLDPTASFPAATKTLTGNGDEDTAYTFVFIMRDSNLYEVATGTATVYMSGVAADVTWTYVDEDALTYTSTGTYYYTIEESQYYDGESYLGVDYTNTTYTMVVTVTIDGDENSSTYGQLVASYVIYENYGANDEDDVTSADFVNTYDASDTTFTLVGSKSLTGRTLSANAFTFSIQEYKDDTYTETSGEAVTAQVEASGSFDHTFTFDEVGTYYFTVTEKAGSESGMDYDETIYYLKLVVDSTVDTTNNAAVL